MAIFFYNPCGGDTIAVLWKPIVRESIEFDVNLNNKKKLFSIFISSDIHYSLTISMDEGVPDVRGTNII